MFWLLCSAAEAPANQQATERPVRGQTEKEEKQNPPCPSSKNKHTNRHPNSQTHTHTAKTKPHGLGGCWACLQSFATRASTYLSRGKRGGVFAVLSAWWCRGRASPGSARPYIKNQIVSLPCACALLCRRDLLPDALMVVGKRWLARSPASAGTPGKERVCEATCAVSQSPAVQQTYLYALRIACRLCWMVWTLSESWTAVPWRSCRGCKSVRRG